MSLGFSPDAEFTVELGPSIAPVKQSADLARDAFVARSRFLEQILGFGGRTCKS